MPTPPNSPKADQKQDEQQTRANPEQNAQPTPGNQPNQNAQPPRARGNVLSLFGFSPRAVSTLCPQGHVHVVDFDQDSLVFATIHTNDPHILFLLALSSLGNLNLDEHDRDNEEENNPAQPSEEKVEPTQEARSESEEDKKEEDEEDEENEEENHTTFSM
jgi:ribosomal protein L12E/L44/L45/RPP1/RPP2